MWEEVWHGGCSSHPLPSGVLCPDQSPLVLFFHFPPFLWRLTLLRTAADARMRHSISIEGARHAQAGCAWKPEAGTDDSVRRKKATRFWLCFPEPASTTTHASKTPPQFGLGRCPNRYVYMTGLWFILLTCDAVGNWTQVLMHAKHILYQ